MQIKFIHIYFLDDNSSSSNFENYQQQQFSDPNLDDEMAAGKLVL